MSDKGISGSGSTPHHGSGGTSPEHYTALKRNIIATMLLVTIVPMTVMIFINHYQYRSHLHEEMTAPILALANKTKYSFDMLLEARLATVRFIAAVYSLEELSDEANIKRIFTDLKKEFGGFVDMGLVNSDGVLVSYAGPYTLMGSNYSDQAWFQETVIKGKYVSNVFLGYRKIPHIALAVQHYTEDGRFWILRTTIDTDEFDNQIRSMGLDSRSDGFLVDSEGILQTGSKYYGKALGKCPLKIPTNSFEPEIEETMDSVYRPIVIASVGLNAAGYTLVIVKPKSVVLQSWQALKTELFIVFTIGIVIIVLSVFKITQILIRRIKEADDNRENVLVELQHTQKLSSIGRLAAGVAHEINNPLAIINEKAGLMNDLIEYSSEFTKKERFQVLLASIIQSVDRCRKITHRLLGFAKRIDIRIEETDLNALARDVLGFLEQEALFRRIDIRLKLYEPLNVILSDKGQLQQVLLNLLTNAFAAVEDCGIITVLTENTQAGGVRVSVIDNGCGIPESFIKHIFDPFFSAKKEIGTGLGLSISYGIIEKLGGTITVRSVEGKGTEFTVTLPEKCDTGSEDQND
ncbi:MAG: ATP-binding protein [Pseudomonadota bacterium]